MTTFITYDERLSYILHLAERGQTGTPQNLADRLGVSIRTAQRMIETLRLKGKEIVYCRDTGSYRIIRS